MLYHRDVFWNKDFDTTCAAFVHQPYILSRHIKERINTPDKSHDLTEDMITYGINKLRRNFETPFEVEVCRGKIIKFVSRVRLNQDQDICIVFAVNEGYNKIKTAYLNRCGDSHTTLDANKYYKGE